MASSTRFHDIEVKGVIRTSQTGALIGLVTSLPTASAKNKGCAVLYDDTVYLSDGSSWVSQGKIVDVDATVTDGSENPVSGDAVFEKLKSYATTSDAIKALSASGTTITYTKADGTTGTITTQDTDTKVTQTNSTGTSAYPILLKNGTGTGSVTSTTLFDDGVTVQPSTGTITATKLVGVTSDAVNTGKHYTVTINSTDYKQMIAISAADYIANGRGAHMKIACVCKSTVNTSVRHAFIADIMWAGMYPDGMILNCLPSTNANSGVYTLRVLAPKSDSYGCSVDVRGYDANARIVDLAILESDVPYTVTLNPVTNIYNSSHYNYWQFNTGQYNQMVFSNDVANNITGRSNSTWDSLINDRFRFGESVVAGNIVAIASDNLTYKLVNTSVAFRLPIKMVSVSGTYTTTSNYGSGYHTVRGVALTILSGQGLSVPSSYSIGDSLYLVGTLDSDGNFVSDATVSTSMVKGKTNIRFGKVEWLNSTTPTHYSFDAFGTNAYTLDANGKLTHIDGVAVLPGSANALTVNGGSSTKPVYFKDGVPTECGSTLDVDVSGTAADAVILTNARTIDGVSFNGSANITHFGTCSTAAATVAKTVAITGFTLATGARALIKFTVTNTAASPTLNINGTGAKAIQYRGAAISAGYLAANRTYEFVYDGTNYQLVGDLNTDGDTKVTQTNSTAATAYPILLKNGTGTGSVTDSVLFDDGVTITPSTGTVKATSFDGLATKATADGNGNTISNTYETKANAITSLSASGKVITYTKGDGSTGTITTQDNDTDTKVTQTNSTAATAYPILLKNGTGTGTVTNSVLFDDGVTITPSTGTVKATAFDGLATKATSDGNGKNIASTYATKDELKTAVTSALVYKGSVATYGDLPTSGNTKGDVYNVVAEYGTVPAGTNWAWNGSEWDPLGGSVDLSKYVLAETGKGLSSNDFTDDLKTKLDGITASADSVSFTRSLTSGTKVGTITINGTATDLYCQTNTDTKNTAGSTDSSSKLFLIGATSQAANPQTYSHDTAYVGTDGKLYSGGKVVIASGDTATAATKATQDGSGNVITTTYQTKSVGTASRALVSDSSGNIAVSAVTSTELGYLDGVTSNVQTQLNNKENVKTPKTYNIPSDGKWYEVARISKANFASAGYNAYARILCGSDTTNVSGIRHVFVADVTWARGKLANTTTAEWFIQNNCPTVNSNNSGIYAFRILQPNANKDYDIIIELYARYASGDATHYTVPADVTILDSNVPVTMLSAPVASTYNSANHNNLSYNVGQYNHHVSSNIWGGDITGRSGSSWDTLFNDRFKTGATVVAVRGTSNRAIRNAYLSAVNSSGFLQHLQTPDVAFKLPLEGGRPTADFNINATYAQVANRIRGIVNTELTNEKTIDSSSTISASTRYYTKYLIDGGTTFKIGLPLFLKGSLDASGNFVPYYTKTTKTVDSVNYNQYTFYIYSSMQNGATNVLIGNGDHDTTHYTVHYGTAYTLDSSGNLTHIDGKPILDSKVTQTNSTSNTAYPILLKNGTGTGTITSGTLFDDGVTINPSTGTIAATNLTLSGDIWVDEVNGNRYAGMVSEKRENITGLTLDLNTLTLSDGIYHIRKFIEATSGGAANITNLPVSGQPFILDVELVRWAGTSDFVTRQTFASNTQPAYDYVRWCSNGTWGSWTKRVYTDTDTKVTQTNSTSNTAYPVLLKNGTGTGTTTTTALFNSTVTINPSTLRMAGLKGIDYTPGTLTWVGALQGNSAITSTASAGAFSPLLAFKTTNGSMGVGCHQTRLQIYYAAKATVDAGNNNMAKMATLMDESGNASWPGTITASSGFIGNASSATKATQDGNGNVIADTYTKTVSGSSLSVTWASDTSVSGYKYKGTISLTGVTSSHIPVVTFDNAQARSGNYCPVAESGTNVVYIWSKVNTTITIPSVMAVLP